MTAATEAARTYIETVGSGDLQPLQQLLHPDLVARVGDDTFGKEGWLQGLRRLLPALRRNDIRHLLGNGDTAVVVYDFVTDTSAGAVPCVEIVDVAAGQITRIELIFERLHWPEVLAALQ
ncbi:MAG: nuclear transport factor 2 family protein [Dermatophilaceae bacterium]